MPTVHSNRSPFRPAVGNHRGYRLAAVAVRIPGHGVGTAVGVLPAMVQRVVRWPCWAGRLPALVALLLVLVGGAGAVQSADGLAISALAVVLAVAGIAARGLNSGWSSPADG